MSGSGHGLTFRYNPHEEERHPCSYCDRFFVSLQQLGGHLTTHRQQIMRLRREHEAFMERRQRERHDSFPFILLSPNLAFWEAYRRGHPPPPTINFMGVPEDVEFVEPPQVENHAEGPTDAASEEMIGNPRIVYHACQCRKRGEPSKWAAR